MLKDAMNRLRHVSQFLSVVRGIEGKLLKRERRHDMIGRLVSGALFWKQLRF